MRKPIKDLETIVCPEDPYKIRRTPLGVFESTPTPAAKNSPVAKTKNSTVKATLMGIIPKHAHGNIACDWHGLPVPLEKLPKKNV